MTRKSRIYSWEQVYEFEFDNIGEDYEIEVDLSPITVLYQTASADDSLAEIKPQKTPIGINKEEKREVIRVFEWLEIARVFKNGAMKSFEDKSFKAYSRQDPWYLLACEHEEVVCLIIEISKSNEIVKKDCTKLVNMKKPLRDNYDKLASNSCFEIPSLELLEWMKKNGGYDKYLEMHGRISFEKIENKIAEALIYQYKKMNEAHIECGGIFFDWYAADPGRADAFGIHFRYDTPIQDLSV